MPKHANFYKLASFKKFDIDPTAGNQTSASWVIIGLIIVVYHQKRNFPHILAPVCQIIDLTFPIDQILRTTAI